MTSVTVRVRCGAVLAGASGLVVVAGGLWRFGADVGLAWDGPAWRRTAKSSTVGWSRRSGGGGERADAGRARRMKSPCQGQRAGRCSVQRARVRVRRPGSASSRRRRVRAARTVLAGQAEQLRPAQQVVRERGEHGPGAVGVEVAGGEVRQRLVFEVADDQLDDGVLAVLGLDDARCRSVRLVMNAKCRQSGNSSAWAPSRRVRRTISRRPPSVVSAICASPSSG